MNPSPIFDHAAVMHAISQFHGFAKRIERPEMLDRLRPFEDRYRAGFYRLVLVGEEKRGKSSLASALLGEPTLLPSGPEPMTAAVFKIIYGERLQHRVFFLPDDPDRPDLRPDPMDVTPEEAACYGSESGNPGNVKRVDFIAVECPHPLLKAGLTIVDLPGLGGLNREHGLLTVSYLPNADAAMFVTDSTGSPITSQELVTMTRLRDHTKHVIFVQTKIDAVSNLQWQSWRDGNLAQLAEKLGVAADRIPYFPVSNILKADYDRDGDPRDLIESGFAPMLAMLQEDLIPRKQDRLAAPMLAVLMQELADAIGPIEDEMTILKTGSTIELETMETNIQRGQQEFSHWKANTLPRIMMKFKTDFADARLAAFRAVQTELDPSPHAEIIFELMQHAARVGPSAAAIEAMAPELVDDAVSKCGARLERIGASFEDAMIKAFEKATSEIGEITRAVLLQRAAIGEKPVTVRPTMRTRQNLWQTAMQGRMGLMVGAVAGKIAVGAAAILFPPSAIATLVITTLGGLFGAKRSIDDARRREAENAEAALRSLLVDTVRRIGSIASSELGVVIERNSAQMLEELNLAVAQRDEKERAIIEAIATARRQTRTETAAKLQVLGGHLSEARALLVCLREAGAPLDEECIVVAA